MYPHWISQGIRFNDCLFSEPARLATWIPPRFPGLFAILACEKKWATRSDQKQRYGENGKNLSVAVLPLPFSTSTQRTALRDELVSAYNPAGQHHGNALAPGDLAMRIGELERRHQEHSEKVLLLLG